MSGTVESVRHVNQVMSLVHEFPRMPVRVDKPVAYSWLRCATEHRLSPDGRITPVVVENTSLLQRRQRLEDLVMIAQAEMDSLYAQISGSGYALLLTDAQGVILREKVDPTLSLQFRAAGLMPGADWSEATEGTNGIGTCIAERRPITIHRNDHFRVRHIDLSCSASPIRAPNGELAAILDASCVGSCDTKASRTHTVALVNMSARLIEKCLFSRQHRELHVIRFHRRPEFVNLLHDGAIALSDEGLVVAADDMAVALLGADSRDDLIRRPIGEIFDLGGMDWREGRRMAVHDTIVPVRDHALGRRYYASLHAPRRESLPRTQATRNLPETISIHPAENRLPRPYSLDALAGNDPAMLRNLRCAQRVASTDASILLQGPTGSGRDSFARALHLASNRAAGPFVSINCAALTAEQAEAELFGLPDGRFAQARGGTLFIDEVDLLPPPQQMRLLHLLQQQELTTIASDVRVISASPRKLRLEADNGHFREDLLYRLAAVTLTLPALRERADLALLIRRLLAEEADDDQPLRLETRAHARLLAHPWPGNLRELRNTLRTALAMSENRLIRLDDLPADLQANADPGHSSSADSARSKLPEDACATPSPTAAGNPLEAAERVALLRAIEDNRWNMTNTARQLQMSRNTLYRKLKHHGISMQSLRGSDPADGPFVH